MHRFLPSNIARMAGFIPIGEVRRLPGPRKWVGPSNENIEGVSGMLFFEEVFEGAGKYVCAASGEIENSSVSLMEREGSAEVLS